MTLHTDKSLRIDLAPLLSKRNEILEAWLIDHAPASSASASLVCLWFLWGWGPLSTAILRRADGHRLLHRTEVPLLAS